MSLPRAILVPQSGEFSESAIGRVGQVHTFSSVCSTSVLYSSDSPLVPGSKFSVVNSSSERATLFQSSMNACAGGTCPGLETSKYAGRRNLAKPRKPLVRLKIAPLSFLSQASVHLLFTEEK